MDYNSIGFKQRHTIKKGLVIKKRGEGTDMELFCIAEVYEHRNLFTEEEYLFMIRAFEEGCNFIQIHYSPNNDNVAWEALKCLYDELFDNGVHLWAPITQLKGVN